MERRVVITGMATINPLGDNLEDYYNNLIAGKSGIKKWESLDMSQRENYVGGDIGDYDTKAALEKFADSFSPENFKKLKKMFRSATFSAKVTCLTAIDAWAMAGLFGREIDPWTTMTVVGGHNMNSKYIFGMNQQYMEEPDFMDPLSSVEAIDNNTPALITEILGLHGPAFTVGGACASGNLALRNAFRDIKIGEVERAVVSGGLFDMSESDIQASIILQSVVVRDDLQEDPTKACRPFDRERAGFLYSHGAATLIIEDLETAQARGAKIYGEILAVKAGANASHLPKPASQYQARVMADTLKMAGVKPEDVDYANCHATGTPVGDIEEIEALKMTFGDHAKKLKLNAPKSMLGHTCWASPLVETIAGLLQMQHGKLHPTINVDNLDPAIDLDVTPNVAVDHQINLMLKNSFGFGGLNCCSLIKRWEDQ